MSHLTARWFSLSAGFLTVLSVGACTIVKEADDGQSKDQNPASSVVAAGSSATGNVNVPLELTVTSAQLATSLSGYPLANGHVFLAAELQMTNHSLPGGVGEDPTFFSVEMQSHTTITISPATAGLTSPCDAAVKVNPGGTVTCSVAFEIPTSDTAVVIDYSDPVAHATASGTIPTASQACDGAEPSGGAETQCQTCMQCSVASGSCKDQWAAYDNAPDRQALESCLDGCQDDTCMQECAQAHAAAATLHDAAFDCGLCTDCPNDCAGLDNCPAP